MGEEFGFNNDLLMELAGMLNPTFPGIESHDFPFFFLGLSCVQAIAEAYPVSSYSKILVIIGPGSIQLQSHVIFFFGYDSLIVTTMAVMASYVQGKCQ